MPSDKFIAAEPTISEAQLERYLEVKIDPKFSLKEVISFLREGNTGRHIVGPDFEVFIGLDSHQLIFEHTGLDRKHSFITNGSFKIDPTSNRIRFEYNYLSMSDKEKIKVRDAAERKIKSFLVSQGIQIKD